MPSILARATRGACAMAARNAGENGFCGGFVAPKSL